MKAGDTIVALSSGNVPSGVAVVRLSGPQSAVVVGALAGRLPAPRRFSVMALHDPNTRMILDRAVVVWLPGPGTVTGEDMCELQVHGSEAVISAVIRCAVAIPDVRLAERGEFTRRAFVNGRMDLVEAEGLQCLLMARSAKQHRLAVHHMLGGASAILEDWRRRLIGAMALVDAAVEFADEGDVAAMGEPPWREGVLRLAGDMRDALTAASRAELVRRGARVVLAGVPNVGKSSLLNALAGRDAAIVTAVPGTTRDIVEVQLDLGGVPAVVMDTAGLRAAGADAVEAIGIDRSRGAIAGADVVVWVWSRDVPLSGDCDAGVVPDVVVKSKCDLDVSGESYQGLELSVRTGYGMARFVDRLIELVAERTAGAEVAAVVEARQVAALKDSIRFLNDALTGGGPLELVADDLRFGADALGRITGRVDVEDWLDAIFRDFCIGK